MYLRDLPAREPAYRQQWWELTRAHLDRFEPALWHGAAEDTEVRLPLAALWRAAVVRARPEAVDAGLSRLAELSADPPRLAPPYALDGDLPVWDERTPAIPLTGLPEADPAALPLCVTADAVAARHLRLRLRLLDPYGRLAAADTDTDGNREATVELRHRVTGTVHRRQVVFAPAQDGSRRASATFDTAELARPADGPPATMHAWDVWVRLTFPARGPGRQEPTAELKARAAGGLGRHVRLGSGARVLLVQPYATVDRSLAVRVADGLAGGRRVLAARLSRRR